MEQVEHMEHMEQTEQKDTTRYEKIGAIKMDENLNKPVLTIDPEFQGKIPPLTDAEYKQLEENILTAGEVWEPIVVWNGTIVDGHNRYKIVMEHPEIKWRTREMAFADKWEAFDWMYKNQLGRRNLTDEQRMYLLGKLYEARKHTHGAEKGGRGNQYSKVVIPKNAGIPNKYGVAGAIAQEQGVNHATVERAGDYAIGIDDIRENDPEFADAILQGKTKVKKQHVINISKADDEHKQEAIDAAKNNTPAPKKPTRNASDKYTGGGTAEYRKMRNEIAEIVSDMYDTTKPVEYGINDLIDDIRMNAERFMQTLANIIEDHRDLITSENSEIVKAELHKSIIGKATEIERSI